MQIFCTGCGHDVEARLTNGQERYPHRQDLYKIPFWKCDDCGGYVGCHHKTGTPTRPLGYIATPDILKVRKAIHAILDPIWRDNKMSRRQVYKHISRKLGYEYHTGQIKTVEEGRDIYKIVAKLHNTFLK